MKQDAQNTTPNFVVSALPYVLAGVLFFALSFAHDAKSMSEADCAAPTTSMPHGAALPPSGMMGEHPHMYRMHSPLDELDLSDVQQKQIAEIRLAQKSEVCAQAKAAHDTRQALHQLTSSAAFDAVKARALADAHGKAVAELSYLHAEAEAKIWALLTSEQRKRLEEKQQRCPHPRK